MKNTTLCLIWILLLVSCKSVDKDSIIEVKDFPNKYLLNGDQSWEIPYMPNCIGLIDSILIMDNENEPFMVFTDTINFSSYSKFGFKGKGPNEFIYLKFYNDIGNNGKSIWVSDPNKRNLLLYNINDLIRNRKNVEPIQKIYLSPLTAIETSIVTAGDSVLFGGSYSKIGQVFKFNTDKKSINWLPYWPIVKYQEPSDELGQLYYGIVRKKPDGSKVVCALRYFKEIIIIDTHNGKHVRIRTDQPEQYFPFGNINLDYLQTLNYMYFDLYCTNNYIYALFLNVSNRQLLDDGWKKSLIHVIDYNGNSIAELSVDKAINSIAVDENSGIIFGFNKFQDSKMYKFHVPKEFMNRTSYKNSF
jgi:hypothetical protein